MPTPSSDPPPGPSSPRSYSFSTCPDDSQHQSRPGWQADDAALDHPDMEVQRDASPAQPSPPAINAIRIQAESAADESIMYENRMSDEPSSRATTMSPRPQSSATGVTSPAPSGADGDVTKINDSDTGGQVSLESSIHQPRGSDTESMQHATARVRGPGPVVRDPETMCVDAEQDELWSPCMGSDYSHVRAIPSSPSSYLRPGSRFHGTQQSERQVYDVQIEIKQVDMRESFLCGYLRIQGLTEDHPTLTTYFEGEIIGSKYSFFTDHDGWGASPKVDLSHWGKFNAFRPYQKQARKGPVVIRDVSQRENIFMRWKEHFLVPDHRVRTITGASFEGFYYICFNQIKGEVSGIYFHSKSEKFQQLELIHVPDRGCFAATELR